MDEACTILAIDDREDNLTVLGALIHDALPSAKLLTALSGSAGLDLARVADPDVVLLDVVMPGMDGYQTCRAFKADARLRYIPIVFLTALKTGRESRVQALEAGAEGFLTKPVDEVELVAQIRAMIKVKEANVAQLAERRRVERALRESEERFRSVFEHMAAGCCLDEVIYREGKPVNYRIHDVNPAYEEIMGISRTRAQGGLATDVYGTTEAPFLDIFSQVAETGEPAGFESYFAPAGKYLAIRVGCPRKGWFSTVFTDVTEKRLADMEREQLQAQLLQSQKMESLGRLAGGIAHDFNNMLSVILGHVELALAQLDPSASLYTDLVDIREAAQRSADLTRQLLAFARRQQAAPRALDLNESVSAMLGMVRRLIGEDIELVWQPGEQLWPVELDPAQLDQVLVNLCVNARDAIQSGGMLSIFTRNVVVGDDLCRNDLGRSHPVAVPGEYVLLGVQDNGRGMPPEVLARAFDPFFTTKETGQGTGLGLSTVYGVVAQNRGFIDVQSEPGKGAVFNIYLPRHRGAIPADHGETAADAPTGGGEIVLLVEDEPSILHMSERMLKQLGYSVLKAGTPEEALELAAAHAGSLDLLITDVVMPKMNGAELCRRLRESCQPGLRCLFMSGYTADIMAQHGIADEGVYFLPKPFSAGELALKVREALASAPPASSRAPSS